MLCACECLDAATLRQLARMAAKIGSIVINGLVVTAPELEQLAQQSEGSGEPICFPETQYCQGVRWPAFLT